MPVIQHMEYGGEILESVETVYSLRDHAPGKGCIDVSVNGIFLIPNFYFLSWLFLYIYDLLLYDPPFHLLASLT